jgi:hypothetical protein
MEPDMDGLARRIQQAQSDLSEIFYKYKALNDAIKHIGIYSSVDGDLLAHSPDEEGVLPRLLHLQYKWLGQIIGPPAAAIRATREAHRRNISRQVTNDFGRPKLVRIQTEGANLVDQVYGTPVDDDALTFLALTSRAATRRSAYVVNESLLLDDLDAVLREVRELLGLGGGSAAAPVT